MFTSTSRGLLACVSVALASISISPASAELPQHLHLQEFHPLDEELIPGGPYTTVEPLEFGYEVAIRNGLAFIGMPLAMTTGRVAVFTQGTSGWARTATITASDMTSDDRFGQAVSFRDGLLVVGSRRAAYVYKRVNGVWREQQKIVPPAADGVVTFAPDLKHEAGVLAIGAHGNHREFWVPTVRDSVYVFEQDATGKFVRRARIMAPSGRVRDGFGRAISMTNAIIVAGARGAAYILGRNGSGNWVQRQKLVPTNLQAGDFGYAVAVDRGMILVGAPGTPVPGADPEQTARGVVYGFLPGGTQYVESFQLYQRPGELYAWDFGLSIAMFDKHIVVGGQEFEWGESAGAAMLATYSREGSSVIPLGSILRSKVPVSIGIANNLLLVGSPYTGYCPFSESCVGEANLYDLNRFMP